MLAVLPPLRPARAQRKAWEALAPDETGAFVGRKARKVWPWPVVERARRRIVGRPPGRRAGASVRRRWQSLPPRHRRHGWHFTDPWQAHAGALPRWPPRPGPKGEGRTNVAGAINCPLRRRCGVPGRKSCSFSKSLAVHTARIKWVTAKL